MVSSKQYDYLVFIGRFQPLHIGHIEVIERARQMADKVILLIGSSNQPRTPKNIFTYEERKRIIEAHYGPNDWLAIRPIRDKPYNNERWAAGVQHAVNSCLQWSDKPLRGGLIGHKKDASSFYLNMFPQWGDPIDHAINEMVDATDVRKLYFERNIKYVQSVLPQSSFDFMNMFKNTADYQNLLDEHIFLVEEKKRWEGTPHPVQFNTGDAVVIQSGHILLIERKHTPGRGLWALPGGHLEQDELVYDCIIRELREETRLKVAEKVLRGSTRSVKLFDAPQRSLRGRVITHAAHIVLEPGPLPLVKARSDAKRAKWVLLSHVREEEMFEDHYHIIDDFNALS